MYAQKEGVFPHQFTSSKRPYMSFFSAIRERARLTTLGIIQRLPKSRQRIFDLWLATQESDPTPESVLHAYLSGRFPLTCPESGRIYWRAENPRGIMPVQDFHIPGNLKRLLRRDTFRVSIDCCFEDVVWKCADRSETWITPQIVELYSELHRLGFAHSFEVWQDGDDLVGGYFGLSVGGYFVGISQCNDVRDAGKIAFLHCMHTLRNNSFLMHDVQGFTSHLEQFGCFEMPRDEFQQRMLTAVASTTSLNWTMHKIPVETSVAVLPEDSEQTCSRVLKEEKLT